MNILTKLMKNWKKRDSNYSNNSLSVKKGSAFGHKSIKINKYIKDKIYNFKLESYAFFDNYQVKSKLSLILQWSANLIVTGFAVEYCFENRNALSYGLTILLFMFYFEKIVAIIKQPTNKK